MNGLLPDNQPPSAVAVAAALSLVWAFLLFWFVMRESRLAASAWRFWRKYGFFASGAFVAALVAISVYGGGKGGDGGAGGGGDRGGVTPIPRPGGIGFVPSATAGATNDVFRWAYFAIDGDRFDGAFAWPATNLDDYGAIDIFHKESLTNAHWRWIHRKKVYCPEDLETSVAFYGDELPYWEETTYWTPFETTNVVTTPFGVIYTNVTAYVTNAVRPMAGFFRAANQHDGDGDGAPDAVEASLGLDPCDPDMDGDGVPDGHELALGSSPLLTDSDGDGLDDGVEVSWGAAATNGAALWIDTSAATNCVTLFTDTDDGCAEQPMPFPLRLVGAAMTNLAINANGLVGFSSGGAAFGNGYFSNDSSRWIPLPDAAGATVAAFWDDLRIRPGLGSRVSFCVLGGEGCRTGVVEFARAGFHGGTTNDFVSFQVHFSETETNSVRVVFLEASGLGFGESATLGARSSRDDGVEYSSDEQNSVFPGLAIAYHFGCGTDPTKADADGDGLTDPEELELGTDPLDADPDNDDLSDPEELLAGTNPFLADTDGDRLADGWEHSHDGFDPLDPLDGNSDADNDGLSAAEEILDYYTNPSLADTDGDGLSDGAEVLLGTDPCDDDTDGDGLSDSAELAICTNPCESDTDGDEFPDGWETLYGFDPLDDSDPDPSGDADGDGLVNVVEYGIGTSPVLSDTDSDGLSDREETGWVETGTAVVHDLGCASNLLTGVADCRGFSTNVAMPFPVSVQGATACTNLVVGIDGRVNLSVSPQTRLGTSANSTRPMVVAAFGNGDLTAFPVELGSQLRIAEVLANGVRHFVAEFRNFGFDDLPAGQTNAVSFQIDFAENATNEVTVSYFRANAGLEPLSPRALGQEARIRAETARTRLVFSDHGTNAVPGISSTYHFGPGTSPVNSDTDGDGLSDGLEVQIGSNPLASDTDGDGLSDFAEYTAGTDPTNADTDGDGLPDGLELANGFDPLDPTDGLSDADNDGLTVAEEILYYQTNPNLADTDEDGLSDGAEVLLGTNPRDGDTDDDGLSDGEESGLGTNPLSSDSDNDGMPDGWEAGHGLNPLSVDFGQDADCDGLSNGAEYQLGTDVQNADTDSDGLSDGTETALGTEPLQPDTDGDGMDDGWELDHGFDPTTDNSHTARTDDDHAADPDNDGLSNGDECAYGANPFSGDTDGDGVSDATEVAQGTDPCDSSDEGNAANVVRVEFEFGDFSGSESEKYRLEIKPVSGNRSIPKTQSFLNQRYDGTDTCAVPLKPGWKYEVRLRHASTDPDYSGYPDPDYDYRLVMTPLETPPRVILDDPDGLFGTNKSDQASTFTTSPKVAHLYVLKPTVVISKSGQPSWDEMDESEVVLSDEDMRIRITVEPKIPSLDAMKGALGDKYTIFTDTKPEGSAVDFVAADQFVQNDSSSEVRIAKTRAQLKALGLLPANEEDGVNEMAWVDIVQTPGQSYADSEAFSSLDYEFRGKATLDTSKTLESTPPNAVPSIDYMKAAGCELAKVGYGGAISEIRQIMNQADVFYYSGHGNIYNGSINSGFTPDLLGNYWTGDLDCAVIAGCSVLNIAGHRIKSFGLSTRFKRWTRHQHDWSVGSLWEGVGDIVFLGYCYTAPLDNQGAVSIANDFATKVKQGMGYVQAWKEANDMPAGRNACVIDCTVSPHRFWYWDETTGIPVWTRIDKGGNSW